jgi:hypothetical protein
VSATRDGNRFAIEKLEEDPVYIVAIMDGTAWLVAMRRSWKW